MYDYVFIFDTDKWKVPEPFEGNALPQLGLNGFKNHKHSPISSGFVTELGNWIADSRIDYWVYGHSHTSIEGTIGKTKLVSNQLGYLALNEGEDYSPCKTFLI